MFQNPEILCSYAILLNYINTCPVESPTTRSAMKVSSVSPDLWETITPQPLAWASLHASILSVTLPIWFT